MTQIFAVSRRDTPRLSHAYPVPSPRSRLERVLETAWDTGVLGLICAFAYLGWIFLNPLPERPRIHAAESARSALLCPKISLRAAALETVAP